VSFFRRKSNPAGEYRLGNGELLNRQSPRTFFVPPRAEREAVQPGDSVKLLFEIVSPTGDMPSAERMWVTVTEVDGGRAPVVEEELL
jgi:hypothetical protein